MEKKKVKAVNKIRCHCVLDTESSTYSVLQRQQPRQAWKTLKPCGPLVQGNDTNLMGFTLIELLVVVLIIGILAAVAVPQYQKSVLKSRYVQLMVFAKSTYDVWQANYLANGTHTDSWEELDINLPGTVSGTTLTMGDYTCTLVSDKVATLLPRIACTLTRNGKTLSYSIFPPETKEPTRCTCNDSWAEANWVCKSLGGILDDHISTSNYYKLP